MSRTIYLRVHNVLQRQVFRVQRSESSEAGKVAGEVSAGSIPPLLCLSFLNSEPLNTERFSGAGWVSSFCYSMRMTNPVAGGSVPIYDSTSWRREKGWMASCVISPLRSSPVMLVLPGKCTLN